jgi:hypothetical protein
MRATGQSGSDRVRLGGSWDNTAANLRNRNDDAPSDSDDDLGFRCASSRTARRVASTDAAPEHIENSARRPAPGQVPGTRASTCPGFASGRSPG